MRANQIRTIQKRAKQRVLALAIGAVAFAGYGAISLFADDANAVTKTVIELNKVPAIRSVGIRLISGSVTEKAASKEKHQAPQTTYPLPNLVLPAPNLVLPESSNTPSALLPLATAPTPEINLPAITAAGRSELHPPPPMAEILNQSTNGKVLVKLSSDKSQSNPASAAVARVEPIRVSLGDSAKSEVPTVLSVASASVVKNRLPELVKPKPTQIKHTVSLAQSTEIDLPAIDLTAPEHSLDEMSTMSPSTVVAVQAQLAPQALVSQSLDKTRADSRSNTVATPDGFVSLAPPSLAPPSPAPPSPAPPSLPPPSLPEIGASRAEVNQIGGATPPPPSKLDSRWANGSPSSIIELESQSAKAMDISGGIIAITVENEDVCRILHDAKTISLVGNQLGSTLVQIWTNEAKETPMLVRVNVSQPWQKSNSKPTDVRDVKHAVAQAFPKANINVVTNADGTLEVRGTTDSEESAKRILEIVRKVCLVPVKDKVTVSR